MITTKQREWRRTTIFFIHCRSEIEHKMLKKLFFPRERAKDLNEIYLIMSLSHTSLTWCTRRCPVRASPWSRRPSPLSKNLFHNTGKKSWLVLLHKLTPHPFARKRSLFPLLKSYTPLYPPLSPTKVPTIFWSIVPIN
jgi:hypothetical protein